MNWTRYWFSNTLRYVRICSDTDRLNRSTDPWDSLEYFGAKRILTPLIFSMPFATSSWMHFSLSVCMKPDLRPISSRKFFMILHVRSVQAFPSTGSTNPKDVCTSMPHRIVTLSPSCPGSDLNKNQLDHFIPFLQTTMLFHLAPRLYADVAPVTVGQMDDALLVDFFLGRV